METYMLDPGGVIKHNQIERFMSDAINIIYQQFLVMDEPTTVFVNVLKSNDSSQDKQDLFFYLFKYDYNSRLRYDKMRDISITLTKAIFEKFIENNNICIYSATVAFNDAMENYTKYMKVSTQSTSSWFSRTFGSKSIYDTMVKSVPPNAYLIMVAVTFAILQYELMFNQRCVELLQLFENSEKSEKSWFFLNPPKTWDPFHSDTIDKIIMWLATTSHDNTGDPYTKIMSFMRTIGVVDVLNKQFENTHGGSQGNPRPVVNFFKWNEFNRLVQNAGRRRTKTIARKKRNAKKHSFRRIR
jgi:hypothetical protein